MRLFLSVVGVVLLFLALGGCVRPPKITAPEQRKEAVINADKDKVWQMLVATVGMSLPLETMDKSTGLMTTKQVALPVGFNNQGMEDFVYPPEVVMGTWDGMRMSLRILVSDIGQNKTMVKINASYLVWENNVLKTWMNAPSNGSFENGILTALEKGKR